MPLKICFRIALIALLINLAICCTPSSEEDTVQPDSDTYDDSKYIGWGLPYGQYPRTPMFPTGPVVPSSPAMPPVAGVEPVYCQPMNCLNQFGCPGFAVNMNGAAMASYMSGYGVHQ